MAQQRNTVDALSDCGIRYSNKYRIPIFKIWRRLDGKQQNDNVSLARFHLTQLLILRRRGFEPKHKNNYYI